jgi:hypothetical protein
MSAEAPQWTVGTSYAVGAVVERGGSSPYICIEANSGTQATAPPNRTYWISAPAPGVLQSGAFPMALVAWTSSGGFYEATYPVPGLIEGSPLSVTTQLFGTTAPTITDALATLNSAWILGCEALAGNLVVYVANYPNATANPLLPANPFCFISWAVTVQPPI